MIWQPSIMVLGKYKDTKPLSQTITYLSYVRFCYR